LAGHPRSEIRGNVIEKKKLWKVKPIRKFLAQKGVGFAMGEINHELGG